MTGGGTGETCVTTVFEKLFNSAALAVFPSLALVDGVVWIDDRRVLEVAGGGRRDRAVDRDGRVGARIHAATGARDGLPSDPAVEQAGRVDGDRLISREGIRDLDPERVSVARLLTVKVYVMSLPGVTCSGPFLPMVRSGLGPPGPLPWTCVVAAAEVV